MEAITIRSYYGLVMMCFKIEPYLVDLLWIWIDGSRACADGI